MSRAIRCDVCGYVSGKDDNGKMFTLVVWHDPYQEVLSPVQYFPIDVCGKCLKPYVTETYAKVSAAAQKEWEQRSGVGRPPGGPPPGMPFLKSLHER